MPRHVLMRIPGEEPRLIPEQAIPLEKDLHDVLTEHPELIPAEDLQLGRLVVVGRESALASGYADLVCVDQHGDVCLVEVKKEGNPDTRRVVAQLLDYAGALWGKTPAQVERDVLLPYLRAGGGDPKLSLNEYLSNAFASSDDEANAEIGDELENALAATL